MFHVREFLMVSNLYNEFMQELRNRKLNSQKSFFHYTTGEGLSGILKNKKIWFSHTKFLNDEQERCYTYKILIDEINNMPKSDFNESLKIYYDENSDAKNNVNTNCFEHEYYLACFSNNKDSLSLWNYYTKNENSVGFNIEFNKNSLISALNLSQMDVHGQVIYEEKEQRRLIKNILTKYNKEFEKINKNNVSAIANICVDISLLISFYSLFFKHPAYKHEEEYRIAIGKNKIYNNHNCLFRTYKNLFIPYFEREFSSSSIKSITISPTQKQQITKESLNLMLSEMNYHDIKIINSDIPLRY